MTMTNAAELGLLALLLNNTDWAGIGDATGLRGSSTAGSLYVTLFTADPTDTGSMAAEVTTAIHGDFARVAIARTSGAVDCSANPATNLGAITFATGSGGTGGTATHWGLCKSGTLTTTDCILSGAIGGSGQALGSGVTPTVAIGGMEVAAD